MDNTKNGHAVAHDTGHHGTVGHVMSLKMLFFVWGVLIVGTVLTVAATWVDLGSLNIWLALGIATVKALMVALFFMHLIYDKPINGIIFISSILFVSIFLSFCLLDTGQYQPRMIPNYAPSMGQKK